MDTKSALVSACVEDPDDELCRYALADWLEEHGEDAAAASVRSGDLEILGGSELDGAAMRALLKTREPHVGYERVDRTTAANPHRFDVVACVEWVGYFDDLRHRNVRKTYAARPYLIPGKVLARMPKRQFQGIDEAKAALLAAAQPQE
jgi:uncharacterized protein (TIGR02996 family)